MILDANLHMGWGRLPDLRSLSTDAKARQRTKPVKWSGRRRVGFIILASLGLWALIIAGLVALFTA